ncbi:MAG TPA: hypothetical protein VFP43_16470 [Mesorhizobium sp.]|nr:hypothetical protein [Mesorhizobium sp.]
MVLSPLKIAGHCAKLSVFLQSSLIGGRLHPSVEDVTVEAILHALSDPVRVAIFAQIDGSECSQNCSNFLNMSSSGRIA